MKEKEPSQKRMKTVSSKEGDGSSSARMRRVSAGKRTGETSTRTRSTGEILPVARELDGSHERLALILEATTEAHWDWNLETGEFYYGPGWLASLGYSAKDLSRDISFWESIIHPDQYFLFEEKLQDHLSGKEPAFDFECRLRSKSGHYKWFRNRGKVTERRRNGQPLRVVGTIVDIEERRDAIEQLQQSKAQLSALFEATDDYIFSVGLEPFGLLTYNRAFAEYARTYLNIELREGMTPYEILPAERAAAFTELLRRTLELGDFKTDYKVVATGATLHISFHRLMRGDGVFGISAFGRDITERKKTEDALRKSEEKFAKAFRESPMALTLTSLVDHRYLEVNETFEQLSGHDRKDIIGRTPFDIQILADPTLRYTLAERARSEGRIRNIELKYRTKMGEIRDGLGAAELIEIDGEPCMLAVIADVTDQKRAEAALRESEERLRLAIHAGKMYAFEWNVKTDLVMRSEESAKILGDGNTVVSYTGEGFMQRVHPEDREQRGNIITTLTPDHPDYKATYRLVRNNGSVVWLKDSGRGFFDSNGNLVRVVGMTADVTEAQLLERSLRELSGRLINSQEEERRRVGRELHDSIGQHLALLAIRAQRVDSGESDAEGTTRSDVHELYRKIQEIATKVSDLSHQLHSSELEFLGLAIASERLCRDFGRQYGIEIDYQVRSVPRMESRVALCFYRIIQECLRNVGKHSQAERVLLELVGKPDCLKLTVRDDGCGFDPEAAQLGAGLGLLSMRERMNLIGGKLVVSSTVGMGTTITATAAISPPHIDKEGHTG